MSEKPSDAAASSIKRGRGRPPSIDQQSALAGAMDVFWKHGYDGASLDSLVAAAGASRPGLYRTFKDKKTLFLRTLQTYEDTITAEALQAFEDEADLTRAVRAFLLVSAMNNTSAAHPSGCLLVCCATTAAEEMADVQQIIAQSFTMLEAKIAARFATAIIKGELASAPSPKVRARLLLDFMAGQAVRARAGACFDALVEDVEARVATVLMQPYGCSDDQGSNG
ncbi:TetR/AcrR family transcriptional regulator [Woodsholea maritima]|uniref:TetR/AcrR family transcriptional regulator n=1 Tax=Woodsholea maritima TaxID=240237 RepID=UPI0012EACB5F|nr:TetR/AcrR family transcriptional regulator [Woodsholea maritima]